MINTITIAGRVVADPMINFTKSGMAVLNFTIANNRKYKSVEQTTFIDITLFGAYAQSLQGHIKKGIAIDVVGELIQERWENDGKNYYKYKINAKEIDFRIPKSITKEPYENLEGEFYEDFQ
ncbi:single-stranded DNA-binding protein [Campylobacter ureolyticus]|jgi:single-strand DNA-binding protein|uniref:Single-stranded DNA-binding protein n=1 Tax=Campylobacter ureolyticus TaxID=827 RepID=A0A9Q4PUU7_9BACT|nr:single-stranded DNA-binding protein [Campylobacter ureolyticus]MCZ6133809.1 single-stranded DNA-binding protein [Campylobacter ureolyticus]MCZ6162502.1 single-stranded DNA-binding protein [Campylobacter ureolyticus]MCZ6171452.1 single-stranded DNA-binding protein [Campylobacter ureolyticus]